MSAPKDLGKALKAGYMPMFMTGSEIKEHFAPHQKDKQIAKQTPEGNVYETDSQLWDRKLKEAKQTGAERYGKEAFAKSGNSWRSLSGPILARKGIGANTSLESVSKERGLQGVIHVQDSVDPTLDKQQILGGHHRVALSAEQFTDHIFPVTYSKDYEAASQERNYT